MSTTTTARTPCARDHAQPPRADIHSTHVRSQLTGDRIRIDWVRLYCPRCGRLQGVLITGPDIWPVEGTA